MVRAASLFSQLLTLVPRSTFRALVAKHRAERAAKGFSCWTQLVAMLFCHLHDPLGKPPLEPEAGGPVQLLLGFGQAVA